MATRRITLSPTAGYVVKTQVSPSNAKIFLNIAWDQLVPPPPTGTSPEAISAADYVIPIVISDIRTDKDKKGVECMVVDCVYSKALKSKTLREPDFKEFLSMVAIERVEERHDLILSRKIANPNISCKGKLDVRSVLVPVYGAPDQLESQKSPQEQSKSLVQEISGPSPSLSAPVQTAEKPAWSLTTTKQGSIRLEVEMPKMTRFVAEATTLDVEARRIILKAGSPPIYELDELFPQVPRDFHVNEATAEWRIAENRFVITL